MSTAERQKAEGRGNDAIQTVRDFHERLCRTRVLDPACGTGNFLYVALELIKRLEGEVLEAFLDLGGQEALSALEGHTVDPHQFHGMEINPRAVAITELVLWIGYLQWHFRTRTSFPAEPILRAFKNIKVMDAVLSADRQLARADKGKPLRRTTANDEREVEVFTNPKQPIWPQAEFIVGNPPFIGAKYMRERLGDGYVQALWNVHANINESADYVMYWWDHAAELLTSKGSQLQRFGFVTTNSITQVFQRRVVERHLKAHKPISLVMAIPDHPWTKASPDAAAVRIAMTVAMAGAHPGILRSTTHEEALDTDQPKIGFAERVGTINADLTVGVDTTSAGSLKSNAGICSTGVKLHGSGFIISRREAEHLGLGRRPGLERHIREYRNGRDLTAHPRDVLVVDLFGLSADEVRSMYPEVYQHVLTNVKPERDNNNRESYRTNWWIFGEPRREFRPALFEISRYIAAAVIAKHRVFQFLSSSILPDVRLVCFALPDAFHLGVLSSHVHSVWALATGATLEDRPTYITSRCFDPFPFPDAADAQRDEIRTIAEELDAHRKRRQAEHPDLTLTDMYNVLERLRVGTRPDALDSDEGRIFERGLVLILKELHDRLDAAVAAAYRWPNDLSDEEILRRIVALNRERAAEEERGLFRWLRPDYQISRFGTLGEREQQLEAELVASETATKRLFPGTDIEQTAAVMAALGNTDRPLGSAALAASFRQGRRVEKKVQAVLLSLARLGFIATDDGGKSFELRQVY